MSQEPKEFYRNGKLENQSPKIFCKTINLEDPRKMIELYFKFENKQNNTNRLLVDEDKLLALLLPFSPQKRLLPVIALVSACGCAYSFTLPPLFTTCEKIESH